VTRLRRLPLRLRLVAGFSAAMLLVLLAADGFVYWRVEFALDRGLDADLSHARDALDGGVRTTGQVDDVAAATAVGVVFQVIASDGTVLQRGAGTPDRPLVRPGRLTSGAHVNVGALLPVSPDPLRLLVTRVRTAAGDEVYLVVGVRRDHRDEALRELLAQLALASLGALVVTGFVGDRLARSALRPVERYRSRAAQIAAGASGLRLDVPQERDDEVTRLGHTLNDMLDGLERALASERRFVDDASHELRTPLTLLTSRLQLAQRRARTVAEHEEALAELALDVERLRTLADQLLQLGGPTGAGTTPDARLVVQDVVRRHDPTPGVRLPEGPVQVAIEPLALERILDNLLRNAELHGAPPVDVALTNGDGVVLVVSDHGSGLPEGLRATERFARADDARSRPGSGLGLAIVAELVAQAEGRLELANTDPGFVATVRLPERP
jgi:two-component system, OmpR family, sensor kinase